MVVCSLYIGLYPCGHAQSWPMYKEGGACVSEVRTLQLSFIVSGYCWVSSIKTTIPMCINLPLQETAIILYLQLGGPMLSSHLYWISGFLSTSRIW